MSNRPTSPDSTPLTRAYEAANESVTKARDLYRAVVHEEILDPDYYFAQETDPACATYYRWVAGAFAGLWNSIPEYQQTLEAAGAQLNVVREGTIKGWRAKPYANAHEGCIDLAVVLCNEMWDCITFLQVALSSGARARLENCEAFTEIVKRREHNLRRCFASLGDPSEIGQELLAAARIERDKALGALQKNAPPARGFPGHGSPGAGETTQGASKVGKKALAIAFLMDHPGWTDKQIAAAVGVHRSTLYRSVEYKRLRAAFKDERNTFGRAILSEGRVTDACGGGGRARPDRRRNGRASNDYDTEARLVDDDEPLIDDEDDS
jgi:hypothetical protein